ncbi:MAG: hypothetical protein HC795_07865, partial [Coleofasciculaceae cyanobacterium RL_1_1]|nr:hypothetical protein [Coleofasciculaceae cyanobacterium RL_1_1]
DVKAGDKVLFGKYSGSDVTVDGEVRGTPEELTRFAAEWDQPFAMTSDNPDAAWLYANSQRLETRRVGDKLVFHLSIRV